MDCKDINKRLTAWVDGGLPEHESKIINAHLAKCPVCRSESQAIRRISEALDGLPAMNAPAGFSRKTMRAFRNSMERPSFAQWWQGLNLAMRGAVCGAVMGGLLCGAVLGTSLITLAADSPSTPYQAMYTSEGILP